MNLLALQVAGETLLLDAERAVYWPRRRCLLLADVHLGKGSVLRQAGVSVPSGQTREDLLRIDDLIARHAPRRLIVLGDLVHGRASADAPWLRQVGEWRQRHAALPMTLVAGNHDRHFDARTLGFDVLHTAVTMAPFSLRHDPQPDTGCYVLAGHVHPGVVVRDGWRRHRLPAFRFAPDCALLPAFGALTGLHVAPPGRDERVVAVSPAGLMALDG